jgi:hypothetical protein
MPWGGLQLYCGDSQVMSKDQPSGEVEPSFGPDSELRAEPWSAVVQLPPSWVAMRHAAKPITDVLSISMA